jgi:hypothetical protein
MFLNRVQESSSEDSLSTIEEEEDPITISDNEDFPVTKSP